MSIRRAMPHIHTDNFDESREFYVDFLGFEVAMTMGWIMTFASPSNPTVQISVMREGAAAPVSPDISVEVADVEAVHASAIERGVQIVYPLTEEPWGVKRFFAADPNGVVINVLSHQVDDVGSSQG